MAPRFFKHLLTVSLGSTTLRTAFGWLKIRIYFHQLHGYTSSWYIKPISWRLYRQWK